MKPLRLINDHTRTRAIELIKKTPDEPIYELVLRQAESLRTIEQNAKCHSMLTDIAKQVLHRGVKLSLTNWKRICTEQMLQEIGESPELIPSIDGKRIVIIYEKTSKMGIKMMGMLIEYLYAFGAENNVVWKDPSDIINTEK